MAELVMKELPATDTRLAAELRTQPRAERPRRGCRGVRHWQGKTLRYRR